MSSQVKIDIYRQEQAKTFYQSLQDTTAPIYAYWRDPDNPMPRIGGEPRGITGLPYQPDNALQLSMASRAQGFQSPIWLTFDQVKACGGKVRKGEVSTKILGFNGGKDGEPFTPKVMYVFNGDQVQGVNLPQPQALTPEQQATRQAGLDALIPPRKKTPTLAQYNEQLSAVLKARFPGSEDPQENAQNALRREFAMLHAQARLGLIREINPKLSKDLKPFVEHRPNWRELESALSDANRALKDIGIQALVYDKLERKISPPEVKPASKPRAQSAAKTQSKSNDKQQSKSVDDEIPF